MRGPTRKHNAGHVARREEDAAALFSAMADLRNAGEATRFLKDLLTPAEIESFSERWRIARLLDEGALSYREIAAATGASTTTIARVARFLRDEPHQGYRLLLERKRKGQRRKDKSS